MTANILQLIIDAIAVLSFVYWLRRIVHPIRCGCGWTFWTVRGALKHMGTTHKYDPH